MAEYVRAIWRCRFFWLSLVKMDLRTRYRRSVLGLGWSLLHPIAMTIILTTMFYQILHVDIQEFAPFLMGGLACWSYILATTLQGCQCLFNGESYIRQYPAPIAIYPLRTALGAAIHFLLALVVVIGLTWYLKGFANLPVLIHLVPAVALYLVLGWSLAVLAGFANVMFQDTQHLAEVGFQLLFYMTPIIYPEKTLQENHLGWLLQYNPLVVLLRLFREPILHGRPPSLTTYATAGVIVLVAAGAAMGTLARWQRRLVFHL
jgi:homopolymeric O-antigen transport system permease protein